ncbi:MAG: Abi family protein [Caryophanon sp.]|nr:Abi family protein [Caryophanon sp.]
MPADKEFQSVYDQMRLLKARELQFSSYKEAKEQLLSKGYFDLINGFETLLLDKPKSPPKTYTHQQFNDFVDLYEFDSQLSTMIFSKISEFETKLKTAIAYYFTKSHCATLKENNNYIDINYYRVPSKTDGPAEYVSYFKKHKLFRTDNFFDGKFRGTFDGIVIFNTSKNQTTLKGRFTGRFGSTSIREVSEGTLTFSNKRQSDLLSNIHALTTPSNTAISIKIDVSKERIYGLNFIDDCKIRFNYVNEYNNPPFWVTIKTLMLNDILVLMYGLDKRVFNEILKSFCMKPNDKEKFLNSIAILKELRNTCAHFELVNRFRTSSKIAINARLKAELNLKPMRSQYVIRLFDTLKILKQFVNMDDIQQYVWNYYDFLSKSGRLQLATKLLDRMGNHNINEWI